MSAAPECPECDRVAAVRDDARALGEFLEWLRDEEDVVLARHLDITEIDKDGLAVVPGYYPIAMRTEEVLARYFKIDLQKMEAEKRALLEWVRAQND